MALREGWVPGLAREEREAMDAAARTRVRRRFWRETGLAYLYLLPALVILFTFHIYPVFYAFYISLHRWGVKKLGWVGLANYQRVLHDPNFWKALKVTVYYVLGAVPLGIGLSLFFAYLLFQRVAGKGVYRTIFFLPYITSTVAASAVWLWIFNTQHGLANNLLKALGWKPLRWLQEPKGIFYLIARGLGFEGYPRWAEGPSLALVVIILFTVWHYLGFDIVVFLAGLSNIPKELYEAAKIDGAGRWQLFRYITLPLLSPTTFFLVIISTIGSFQAFNQIYVMSQGATGTVGGPLRTTMTVTVYLYDKFYEGGYYGYASAIAFVLFFIILGLTLLQMWVGQKRVHYGE